MKKILLRIITFAQLLNPVMASAFVTHFAANVTDPELASCLEKLSAIEQVEQQVSFATFSAQQSTGTSGVEIYWKQFSTQDSRVLIDVIAPPARRGVKLLVLESDQSPPGLHMYLPELRSVRRITGNTLRGTLLGTDFNYEDFLYLYGLSTNATVEKHTSEIFAERKVFVINVIPGDEDSGYSKIRGFIDQEWCTPLKVEFYTSDSALRKTLKVSIQEIVNIKGHRIPMKLEMEDFEQDTRTKVSIESIAINEPIKDSKFSLSDLRSGR